LQAAQIRTTSVPDVGVWADQVDSFLSGNDQITPEQGRALFCEFAARQWRKVSLAQTRGTDVYMSSDLAALYSQAGYMGIATGPDRTIQLIPPIPLESLVARTTGITGTTAYQALYLTDITAEERFVRITESSEIPRAKLTAGRVAITIQKYGRALEVSYEEMRRMQIDRIAFHIRRLAVQAEIDKVSAVIDVIINGDGNSNAAVATNISSLDAAATGGTVTLKGWLSWKIKWNLAYRLTTILVQEADGLKLLLLNTGSANIPLVTVQAQSGFGALVPMNNQLGDNVEYGVTTDATANAIIGIDRRQAIERVYEIGGNVNEVGRFVTRQTEVMTMTEVEGFSKIDNNATRILNLA
jgi:hypothetical protein